jgi:hypothetical protein
VTVERDRADVIADQVRDIVTEAVYETLRGGPRVPIEIADDARARVRALLAGEKETSAKTTPRGAPGCTCGTPPFAPPEPSGDCPFHASERP